MQYTCTWSSGTNPDYASGWIIFSLDLDFFSLHADTPWVISLMISGFLYWLDFNSKSKDRTVIWRSIFLFDWPVHGTKRFWPNHSWLSPCQVFFCFTRRSYSESPSDFKIDRFDWFLFRLAGGRPPVGSRLRVIWRPWCRATNTTKHRTRKLRICQKFYNYAKVLLTPCMSTRRLSNLNLHLV